MKMKFLRLRANFAIRLVILCLSAFVSVGAAASPGSPEPLCIFDPSGYFYAKQKLSEPFEDFDHLTLWQTSNERSGPANQGLYTNRGEVYNFDSIESSDSSFTFVTDTVNGVSYSYTGHFQYYCIFEEFTALYEAPGIVAAEGTLVKLVKSEKVAETPLLLFYSPKPHALKDDVNASYPSGRTELFYAIRKTDIPKVSDLLKRGARVNVKDNEGATPLTFDIQSVAPPNALTIARMLIAAGADVNLKNKRQTTALKLAVYQFEDKEGDLVKLLLSAGADVNAADDFGTTVLMHAVNAANAEAALIKNVGALIRAGAQVNARNKLGQSPLSIAIASRNTRQIQLLEQAGAKP